MGFLSGTITRRLESTILTSNENPSKQHGGHTYHITTNSYDRVEVRPQARETMNRGAKVPY